MRCPSSFRATHTLLFGGARSQSWVGVLRDSNPVFKFIRLSIALTVCCRQIAPTAALPRLLRVTLEKYGTPFASRAEQSETCQRALTAQEI